MVKPIKSTAISIFKSLDSWAISESVLFCTSIISLTPLFFILAKEKIIDLIKKTDPSEINSNLIEFTFADIKKNKVKILFDKNSLELKGWETKDAYSNKVMFKINNLITNNQIVDDFFKIPKEEDL